MFLDEFLFFTRIAEQADKSVKNVLRNGIRPADQETVNTVMMIT